MGSRQNRVVPRHSRRSYRRSRRRASLPGGCSVVESPRSKPGEPDGDGLVRRRTWRRGGDLKKGGSRTGGARGSVVDAIGGQIRQRASVGIRGRSSPRGIEDPRSCRDCHQEDSADEKAERDATGSGWRFRKHDRLLHSGRPPCFLGVTATPPLVTRLSGSGPDPWLCVPASRRVCP